MTALAVLLTCLAAVLHAAWNRGLHATPDREAALAVAGLAGGLLLLPAAAVDPPSGVTGLILLSATAETAYALALAAAYRRGELPLAYPLARGTAPALVTLGSWIALREAPDAQGLAGAAALGLGLVLLADSGRRSNQLAAVGFALLAGVAIATYSVADAAAARRTSPAGYLGAVLLLQGAALTAFQLARAGEVATLRETSVLLVVLFSARRRETRVWAAAVLVVLGAVLAAA